MEETNIFYLNIDMNYGLIEYVTDKGLYKSVVIFEQLLLEESMW